MFRLALIILILAALVVFALQNIAPVLPLVFLGTQTQALPLAVWVVGAIAAGALTTGLLAVLIRLAGAQNGSRARRPKPRRASGRSSSSTAAGTPWTPPPWTGDRNSASTAQPTDAAGRYGKRVSKATSGVDDWEQPRQASESWDNWDDEQPVEAPRRARPPVRTVIQDAAYTDVTEPRDRYQSPSYGDYGESEDSRDGYRDEGRDNSREEYQPPSFERDREEWDDWEEEEFGQSATSPARSTDRDIEPAEPPRNIVEIKREPQSGYQTGSVFSYTYRPSAPLPNESAPPEVSDSAPDVTEDLEDLDYPPLDKSITGQTSSVYDAEFRVIIPPYRAEPDTSPALDPFTGEPDLPDLNLPDLRVDPDLTPTDPNSSDGSDNWDEPDADEFSPEPQRREPPQREQSQRRPPSRGRISPDPMEREVWDDWDDDEDDDEPPPPSTSPEGNPPLRLG